MGQELQHKQSIKEQREQGWSIPLLRTSFAYLNCGHFLCRSRCCWWGWHSSQSHLQWWRWGRRAALSPRNRRSAHRHHGTHKNVYPILQKTKEQQSSEARSAEPRGTALRIFCGSFKIWFPLPIHPSINFHTSVTENKLIVFNQNTSFAFLAWGETISFCKTLVFPKTKTFPQKHVTK